MKETVQSEDKRNISIFLWYSVFDYRCSITVHKYRFWTKYLIRIFFFGFLRYRVSGIFGFEALIYLNYISDAINK